MRLEPVTGDDLRGALERTKPTAHKFAAQYKRFSDDFGSC